MKMRTFFAGFAAGSAAMVLVAMNFNTSPQDPAEMEKMMMESMEKYGIPAAEHAELAKRAGTWDVDLKFWMAPDTDYQTMGGTAQFEMIMDGRYLMQHYQSEFMGETFEGAGLTGYDRIKGEYQNIWIDSMGTAISQSSGHEKDGAIVFTGEMGDPMMGKYVPVRSVEKMVDDDTLVYSMFRLGPDGKEFKSMEITYTRTD